MKCDFQKYTLHFKKQGGTSRGILYHKDTYILKLKEDGKVAYGEANLFKGLSYDDQPEYEKKLSEICDRLPDEKENILQELSEWPSIKFGVETLLKDWRNGAKQLIFPENIQKDGFNIPTNGLIWMGSKESMMEQIVPKLEQGYTSIKLKIGAIDFAAELALMQFIRQQFSTEEVEIRVDANGAFKVEDAKEKLKRISDYGISYIEQPIQASQWQEMATLVKTSPVKIALDEELIGIQKKADRKQLIEKISPHLLILKPALIGGFEDAEEWKELIEENGGSRVITSALESNIGLNAIAQYTAGTIGQIEYAQGLGTGKLFTNNFPSPYTVDADGLHYHLDKKWDFSLLR